MPEEIRRRSFEHGSDEATVNNKLRALILAAADKDASRDSVYPSHHKNTTGIVGQSNWSDNEEVNRLWEKYSKPAGNGKRQ